ncbi:TPA: hypothetical protein KTX52_002985 [Enterococcus faecium]|nr:hypothetical protein [Enterococcus faecium]
MAKERCTMRQMGRTRGRGGREGGKNGGRRGSNGCGAHPREDPAWPRAHPVRGNTAPSSQSAWTKA